MDVRILFFKLWPKVVLCKLLGQSLILGCGSDGNRRFKNFFSSSQPNCVDCSFHHGFKVMENLHILGLRGRAFDPKIRNLGKERIELAISSRCLINYLHMAYYNRECIFLYEIHWSYILPSENVRLHAKQEENKERESYSIFFSLRTRHLSPGIISKAKK